MISAAQLRAARGLLDWTRAELAKAAGISPETIKNIEHGTFKPQEATAAAIERAFAIHGVEFTDYEGVRLHSSPVVIFDGVEGFKKFMDDVYEAACDKAAAEGGNKPICVSNVDDKLFVEHLGNYADVHVERMNKIQNIKVRVLTGEKDYYTAPNSYYIEYRWSGVDGIVTVPFYVYGDKFAVILFTEHGAPKIVVISSPLVAKAYREQFDILWRNARKVK